MDTAPRWLDRHESPTTESYSFPQVGYTKDGQLQVTLTIPVHLPSEVTPCSMTVLIASEDLRKLAQADKPKLGEELAWQAYLTDMILTGQQQPLPVRRARSDTMLKYAAGLIAKLLYPGVKFLLQNPDMPVPAFAQVIREIRATHNISPRA